MNGMDLWFGLDTAPTFEHGTYFIAGTPIGTSANFITQIQKCMVKPSQKSGVVFVVETEVMVSNSPLDPVGSRRSWVQKLSNQNIAWPNIKSFIYACLGLYSSKPEDAQACAAVDQVIKGIMNLACGERNMLSKAIVNLECTMIPKQKDGEPFTRHSWNPAVYPQGVSKPDWSALMAAAPQALGPAPMQMPQTQAPGWGQQPTAPGWGVPAQPPPPGAPPQNGWGAPQTAPGWGAPPAQAQPPAFPQAPPPPPQGPQLPPGAIVRDGMFWAPGMPNWLPLPK